MRYKIISIFLLLSMSTGHMVGAQLIDPTKFFSPGRNEQEEQITHLKEELVKIQTSMKEHLASVQSSLAQANKLAAEVKNKLQEAPGHQQDFLTKKASLLNDLNQTLFNIQFQCKEIPSFVEQRIKLLEESIKDPHYKTASLEPRSFYAYEVFQNEIKRVFDQEDKLKVLATQKNDETIELENRKKKLDAATKSYQDKKNEQEVFAAKVAANEQPGQLGFKQQGELFDLEEKRALYEQELAELKVQATLKKIELVTTGITVEQEKIAILKNNLSRAKGGLRIAESEVRDARDALEKLKQKSWAIKESFYEEIKKVAADRDILKQELDAIGKRYKLSVLEREKFATWSVEAPTVELYNALCEVGYKNEQIQFLERKIEYLRAEIQREDALFRREEIKTIIFATWFDLAQRKLVQGGELLQALKKFKELEAETNRELNACQDQRNAEKNLLTLQTKSLSNLRGIIQDIEKEKETLFKRYPLRLNACLVYSAEAERILTEQVDGIGKIVEVYSASMTILNGIVKEIGIVTAEVEKRTLWQRSQYAISWQGIKNLVPDLIYFISEVRILGATYFSTMTFVVPMPGYLLFIFLFLVVAFGLYVVLRIKLPIIRERLFGFVVQGRWSSIVIKGLGCVCVFLEHYLIPVYSWFVIGMAFYTGIISDVFLSILFYLISIPFVIYYLRKLVRSLILCNRQHQFCIFAELFEKRFSLVFSIFAYMTVFVWFFREAFILSNIYKSELPNIIFAAYSIFLRTLIIFSIGKEEILVLIPKRGTLWAWIAWIVEQYYYLLLIVIIALMVVSDPYVGGYGNLISYILWGLIGSALLARGLYLLHFYIKKYSEYVFFSADEETKRERFSYGKTWYGIFVIGILIAFIILGIVIGTKIWDIPISLDAIWNVFDFKLFTTGMERGEPIPFTPRKLCVFLGFIFGSFLAATAFTKFVLQRIFDIFPVDLGVQNTIITITRYLIVASGIFIGFHWAGLSNFLIAVGVVIAAIGYQLKESIGDFISYFIILVQRPIEVGDYIMLSGDIEGVVRKITPRSVIVRRKDSYTIIVPNSLFLTQPISNLNYARNFTAFEDICLTVAYTEDPHKVKHIIQQVLDENIEVLKSPRPVIRLNEFGHYGFVFMIRGFLSSKNISNRADIASDIRFALVTAFVKNDIKIAVPTQLVMRDPYDKH